MARRATTEMPSLTPESLATLCEQAAETTERSAVLAELHGDRLRSNGHEAAARREFDRAEQAHKAAARGRTLASRLRATGG